MLPDDKLPDEETVYRSILDNHSHYSFNKDGSLRISSQAFADRNKKPSVDIASKKNFHPSLSKLNSTDGIIDFYCSEIRNRVGKLEQSDNKGKVSFYYLIDIIPRPLEDNPAHAQIEPNPEYQSKSRFRKVQESLARLATEVVQTRGWAIEPESLKNG